MNRRFFVRILLFLAIIVIISTVASAQTQDQTKSGYNITEIAVGSGEDAVSSGLSGRIRLENENKKVFEIVLQVDQAWTMFGPKFKIRKLEGLLAGSVGHLQGAPWAGAYLNLSVPIGKVLGQDVSLSTIQWPIFFGWEPTGWKNDGKPPNTESMFAAYLAIFQANVGPIGVAYTKLNFLDDSWNTLPGVSYTQNIRKDISVTGSTSWNGNAQKWMFYLGTTWSPQK